MNTFSPKVTFAITSGIGYFDQSEMLIESIESNMPDSNIVLFIPDRSYYQLDQKQLISLEKKTDIYHGEIPRSEYPLTALTKAFEIASEKYDTPYFVQLDSDILVLNELELPASPDNRLFAKPTNLGSHYWASSDAADQWEEIYDYFGSDVPELRIQGTFDGVEGFPVWNGGVIATTDPDFSHQWLEMTKEVLDSGILGDDFFYAEQISLSILGTLEYDVTPLKISQNYAQEYIFVPSDIQLFHYGDPRYLPFYFAHPNTYNEIQGYWSGRYRPSLKALFGRCMSVLRGRSRRHLSRSQRLQFETLGASFISLLPNGVEEKIRSLYG